MAFFDNFLRPAPDDPSNADTRDLWRELAMQYVGLQHSAERAPFLDAFLAGGGDAALARNLALLDEHIAVQRTLERLPVPPRPPFPTFRLTKFMDRPVVAALLTTELWAVVFVGLLNSARETFAGLRPDSDYRQTVGRAPSLLLLLIAKRAAELGGWHCPRETEVDWVTVRRHYRSLANVGRAPENRLPE